MAERGTGIPLSAAALPEPVIQCGKHEISRDHQQPPYLAHDLDHGPPPLPQRVIDSHVSWFQPTMSWSVPPCPRNRCGVAFGRQSKAIDAGVKPAHADLWSPPRWNGGQLQPSRCSCREIAAMRSRAERDNGTALSLS